MIQPYFRPDVNPTTPAFAVYYNSYFKERSRMNMQIMNLMLQQASPKYLTNMIQTTQSNIEQLRKAQSQILKSQQDDKMKLASQNAKLEQARSLANQREAVRQGEFIAKSLLGKTSSKDASGRSDGDISNMSEILNKVDSTINNIKEGADAAQLKKEFAKPEMLEGLKFKVEEFHKKVKEKGGLTKEDKESPVYELINNYSYGDKNISDFKKKDEFIKELNEIRSAGSKFTATDFEDVDFSPVLESAVEPAAPLESRLDALGFTLTPQQIKEADEVLDKDGNIISDKYDEKSDEEKEIIQKRIQNIKISKRSFTPRTQIDFNADYQKNLDQINEQIKNEQKKLESLYLRFDRGQQDALTNILSPFSENYRTENLFVRKSPEVLQKEQELLDMQYKAVDQAPVSFPNLEYNTEYQAPGGLNFGITKVGQEEIPYIFEQGAPYEIDRSDPSYSFIVELLSEQDKKLGGI